MEVAHENVSADDRTKSSERRVGSEDEHSENAQQTSLDGSEDEEQKLTTPVRPKVQKTSTTGSPSMAAGADMPASPSGVGDTLPRATVSKLINELLPPGIVCPKETRELVLQCCNEFIQLVTGEANDICEQRSKKTIAPEHICEALRTLGFGEYVTEAEATCQAYEQQQRHKQQGRARSRNLLEQSGLTEGELQQQQQELFEAARRRYLAGSTTPADEAKEAGRDEAGADPDDVKSEIESGTKPLSVPDSDHVPEAQ